MRALLVGTMLPGMLLACSSSDVMLPDAGVDGGMCPLVGPWRACDPRCAQDCGDDAQCSFELGLCAPSPPELGVDTCVLVPDYDTTNQYCYGNDRFCATTGEPGPLRSGTCVPRELCDDVPDDIPFECFFSDRTPYGSGPPAYEGECSGDSEAGFCGGPCGDCGAERRGRDFQYCVGISEARGVGMCAVSQRRCDYRYPIGDASHIDMPERACLLTATESDVGWVVLMDTCLAYRDRFEGIECRNESWNIVP